MAGVTLIDEGDDPYRWLEELDGADAAGWVRERNAATVAALTGDDAFADVQAEIRQVLDADDRIPYPGWRGDGFYYGFWRDAAHPRGLWRRTTLAEYRRPEPAWDVLLDLDALAAAEGENWVWGGVAVLKPGHRRCLVSLSRGGADAVVVREFDLATRAFVADGFTLARGQERRQLDRRRPDLRRHRPRSRLADHLRLPAGDPAVAAGHPAGRGRDRVRGTGRRRRRVRLARPDARIRARLRRPQPGLLPDPSSFLLTADGGRVPIAVPDDARWDVHREWLLIRPRSPWAVGGVTHPAGRPAGGPVRRRSSPGTATSRCCSSPTTRTALSYHVWTRHHLILATLVDVAGGWRC